LIFFCAGCFLASMKLMPSFAICVLLNFVPGVLSSHAADSSNPPSAEELANKAWGPDDSGATPNAAPTRSVYDTGEGVNGTIYAAVALADGSVVLGGEFNTVDTQPRSNLARILPDGTLDTAMFGKITDGVNGTVFALAVDAKGGLLVGGYFSEAQEKPRQNFVRYNPDGSLDQAFGGAEPPNGPNGRVFAIAIQPDGHLVIGGLFSEVGTAQRHNVAKLNPDGTVSGSQTAVSGVSGTVRSLAVLPNGAVVAGGMFEVVGSTARSIIGVQP
jgi:uncharacterized delta-60 repeat protein